MDDFIKVIKRHPKVRIKINNMLDRYNRLPFNYQSKIGYDTLIQNVNRKELINIIGYNHNRFRHRIKNEN